MAGISDMARPMLAVIYHKRVFAIDNGIALCSLHIILRVPDDGLCLVYRGVMCDGVCARGLAVPRQHVDARGGDGERGVIPCKRDVCADFHECLACGCSRCEHGDAAWASSRVD